MCKITIVVTPNTRPGKFVNRLGGMIGVELKLVSTTENSVVVETTSDGWDVVDALRTRGYSAEIAA